jgi:hypothetical protein
MPCTIDRNLVRDAERLMTGANVHTIRTLILCYELSVSNSTRLRYKRLLTQFVCSSIEPRIVEERLAALRDASRALCDRTEIINRWVKSLPRRKSRATVTKRREAPTPSSDLSTLAA